MNILSSKTTGAQVSERSAILSVTNTISFITILCNHTVGPLSVFVVDLLMVSSFLFELAGRNIELLSVGFLLSELSVSVSLKYNFTFNTLNIGLQYTEFELTRNGDSCQ